MSTNLVLIYIAIPATMAAKSAPKAALDARPDRPGAPAAGTVVGTGVIVTALVAVVVPPVATVPPPWVGVVAGFVYVVVTDGVATDDDSRAIWELGMLCGLPPESGRDDVPAAVVAALLLAAGEADDTCPPVVCEADAEPLVAWLAELEDGRAAEDEDDDPWPEAAPQVRLYSGVVVSELPMTPKLGLGVAGAASWSVYHQTLVVWKMAQPTSCQ